MTRRIAVDTTYILPSLGVKVKELSEEDLGELFRQLLAEGYETALSDVSLIEALGKALRHAIRSEEMMGIVERGCLSILTSERFQILTHATPSTVEIALDLRKNGLDDLFDCLITGTAIAQSEGFITEDAEIPKLVKETDYAYFPIWNLKEFRKRHHTDDR